MRLLRVGSAQLELVEFQGDAPKPYAILSHTWGDQEVLYADLRDPGVRSKAGYRKIYFAIKQAQKDGYEYLWVDTCCIDKSSSAELSEAINSMYYWYQQAAVCYVYLSDVLSPERVFEKSRWFTRGWTLQELLAPQTVLFYSQSWNLLGDKISLASQIFNVTGIDTDYLTGQKSITQASVAKRMYWASARETTRIEDMAYCLLGLFSVNMPLLYGERENAFIRLQEEIIKVTDDQTIFAWKDPSITKNLMPKGLLAQHPKLFAESSRFIPCTDDESKEPHSMNNERIKIEVRVISNSEDSTPRENLLMLTRDSYFVGQYTGLLNCIDEIDPHRLMAIQLTSTSRTRQEYQRVFCHRLWSEKYMGTLSTIFVPQLRQIAASTGLRPSLPRPPDIVFFLRHFRQTLNHETSISLIDNKCGRLTETALYLLPREIELEIVESFAGHIRDGFPGWLPTYFKSTSYAGTPMVALRYRLQRAFQLEAVNKADLSTKLLTSLQKEILVLLGTTPTVSIGCCAILEPKSSDLELLWREYELRPKRQFCELQGDDKTDGIHFSWSATLCTSSSDPTLLCYAIDFAFRQERL